MTSIHLINPAPRAPVTPGQADDAVIQLEQSFVEIAREELGMHEVPAQQLASALVRGMRKRYGGGRLGVRGLYIPAPSKTERNESIRREYDGTNGPEVMRRHGIKRTQFFEIVGHRPAGAARIGISGHKSPVSSLESGLDKG